MSKEKVKDEEQKEETETKREKFKRICPPRLTKILNQINRLSTMLTAQSYEVKDEDVNRIEDEINNATASLRLKYNSKTAVKVEKEKQYFD